MSNYYGKTETGGYRSAINEAYDRSDSKSNKIKQLAKFLARTKVPKYVRLAKFLNEIEDEVNVEKEKAKVLLKKSYSTRDEYIKTTYKGVKEIEKRAKKVR